MPAGVEVFGNQPTATVTAGGTTTSDTAFTVTATNSWPTAATSTTPNTFFHIVDAANTSEIMLVTVSPGGSGVGQSWTVARAQEGTTGISHSANWTAVQLITAGTLQNFKQASTSSVSAVNYNTSTTEVVVATFQPLSGDIAAGTTYHLEAFGTIQTTTGPPTMTWNIRWGGVAGTSILSMLTGTDCPPLTVSVIKKFDVNGTFTFLSSTSAVGNINFWWQPSAANTTTANTGIVSSATGVPISGSGPLVLTAKWSASSASNALIVPAPFILRVA